MILCLIGHEGGRYKENDNAICMWSHLEKNEEAQEEELI